MNTIYISSQKRTFRQFVRSIFRNIDTSIIVNELPHNYTMHKLKGRTDVNIELGNIPLKDLHIENTICSINIYHKGGFPITQIPLSEIGEVENYEYRIHQNHLLLSLVHKKNKASWFQQKINRITSTIRVLKSLRRLVRQV